MADEYVEIEAVLKRRTEAAVLLKTENAEAWVPRSCLHAASDIAVNDMEDGEHGEFRLRRWIADRESFI